MIFSWSFARSTARLELKVLLFWVEMLLRHPSSDPQREKVVFIRDWMRPFGDYLVFSWSLARSMARLKLKVLLIWVKMLLRHLSSDPRSENGVFILVWLKPLRPSGL